MVETSIIIPTLNEAQNISILISKIKKTMEGNNYEIIVVDDNSEDGTWAIADKLLKEDSNGFCIKRMHRNGLSAAVVEGMSQASGDYLIVMDGDMQHDETIIPKIVEKLKSENTDICVCSRNLLKEDGYGDLTLYRKFISKSAIFLFHTMTGKNLTDPVSGFFGIKKPIFDKNLQKINPTGFKILLEFIKSTPPSKITEIGYQFKKRVYGHTKLTIDVSIEYLLALIDMRFGWLIPIKFVKFGVVGFFGSLINYFSFINFIYLTQDLLLSAIISVQLGILWSYFCNNFFTFSEQRFRGKKLFLGLIVYEFLSLYGLTIQYLISRNLLDYYGDNLENLTYFIYAIAVLGGSIVNFLIHSNVTWKRFGKSFENSQ